MEAFNIIKFTESDVDKFIKTLGGKRVDAISSIGDSLSADYILEDSIIELKIIEEEPFEKEIKQMKFAELFGKNAETVVIDPRSLENSDKLKYFDIFNTSIKTHVKKASKQLRSTQERFGFEETRILFLINNGIYALFPDEFQDIAIKRVQNDTTNIDILIVGGVYFYGDMVNRRVLMPIQEYYINGSFGCRGVKRILSGWGTFCRQYMTRNVKNIDLPRKKEPTKDIIFEIDQIRYVKPIPYLGKSEFYPAERPREDTTGQDECPTMAIVLPDFTKQGWEIAKKEIVDSYKLKNSFVDYKNWISQQKEDNAENIFCPIVEYLIPDEECANKKSFDGLCSLAAELFNRETEKIVFERTFEYSTDAIALTYIFMDINEIGVDKANDVASLYYVSEIPGCEKRECIINGKRMKYEFGICLASVYAILKNASCVYYRRNQRYMWR